MVNEHAVYNTCCYEQRNDFFSIKNEIVHYEDLLAFIISLRSPQKMRFQTNKNLK